MSKRKGKQDSFPILYKIIFKQKEFVQYIKYAKEVPVLEEYTFCLWYKPSNMAHDHTLFSYSGKSKKIYIIYYTIDWIGHK